tara:strand:- start:927 stop:1361 length:435 start_codon:yes stop_codon:yes gene_type:complete
MNIATIRGMVEKDLKIDSTELDLASLRIPQLHNKYLNIFHDERLLLKKMKIDFKELSRSKWEYYTGKMDQDTLDELGWEPFPLKILKTDIDRYLDSDKDLSAEKSKIDYQEEKVLYLESVLKNITNLQWNIKNAIEWRKFLNGT